MDGPVAAAPEKAIVAGIAVERVGAALTFEDVGAGHTVLFRCCRVPD